MARAAVVGRRQKEVLLASLAGSGEVSRWARKSTALARAAKEKRPVLALFTGSDWCPYCVQLEKKVLKDSSFQKFAEKNVVLLYLDFPRKKQLDAKLTAQNKKLAVKYGVRGYPTSLLLNARGETIGKVTARNARGYIRDIEQLAAYAKMPLASTTARSAKISSGAPSPITSPWLSTIMRSANWHTSCISCVAMTTVSVMPRRSLMVRTISRRVAMSRFAVGSSSKRIGGLSAMPMASDARRI